MQHNISDFFFLLLISYILENTNSKKLIRFSRLFIYFYFYFTFFKLFYAILVYVFHDPAAPEESAMLAFMVEYLIFFILLMWSLKNLRILSALLWFLLFFYYYVTIVPFLFPINEIFAAISILSFLLLAVFKVITFKKCY